jgi:hypothetical protein
MEAKVTLTETRYSKLAARADEKRERRSSSSRPLGASGARPREDRRGETSSADAVAGWDVGPRGGAGSGDGVGAGEGGNAKRRSSAVFQARRTQSRRVISACAEPGKADDARETAAGFKADRVRAPRSTKPSASAAATNARTRRTPAIWQRLSTTLRAWASATSCGRSARRGARVSYNAVFKVGSEGGRSAGKGCFFGISKKAPGFSLQMRRRRQK